MKNQKIISFLMCRNPTLWVKSLSKFLNNNDIINIIISDEKSNPNSNVITYPDKNIIDTNMHGFDRQNFKRRYPTAWDKTIYHIFNSPSILFQYDYYYFIEDDVYCKDLSVFTKFINELQKYNQDLVTSKIKDKTKENLKYPFWIRYKKDKKHDKEEMKYSFNPFCRFSNKFLKELFDFYERNNLFYFHEIMLPTIAYNNELSMLNFEKEKSLKNYLGTWSGPTTKLIPMENLYKISHPYKIKELNRSFRTQK